MFNCLFRLLSKHSNKINISFLVLRHFLGHPNFLCPLIWKIIILYNNVRFNVLKLLFRKCWCKLFRYNLVFPIVVFFTTVTTIWTYNEKTNNIPSYYVNKTIWTCAPYWSKLEVQTVKQKVKKVLRVNVINYVLLA